jgi:hypothetical protein
MQEQEIEEVVEHLSRGIVAIQYQGPHQVEHVETLKRLIAVGDRAVGTVREQGGVMTTCPPAGRADGP